MYIAKLNDTKVSVQGPDLLVTLTYPFPWMAVNAYYNMRDCCERFNKDSNFNENMVPKIYVFGEIHTWPQYLERLMLTAKKIGAKIHLKSTK